MIDQNDTRIEYASLDEVATPRSGFLHCYIDHWWCVHPEHGIVIFHHEKSKLDHKGKPTWRDGGSPQCNRNGSIAEHLIQRLYPWAEIKQLPVVFLRHDCRDYV